MLTILVTIPESLVYKSKQNIWLVDLWIAEELFDYLHPFLFSDFFNEKLPMDEFQVLFEIVKIFSSSNTRKEFNTQEFLHSYPSPLNSLAEQLRLGNKYPGTGTKILFKGVTRIQY
jgi:hypothetical protein